MNLEDLSDFISLRVENLHPVGNAMQLSFVCVVFAALFMISPGLPYSASIVLPTMGFLLLNRPESAPCFSLSRMAPENSVGQTHFVKANHCEM